MGSADGRPGGVGAAGALRGIATLTLNAALDRTLHVDGLRIGHKARVLRESLQAGGKGVNVARVLTALGAPVLALVAVGGATGHRIREDLAQSGIAARAIEAPGESRSCLELVEPGGRATQLHGVGLDGGGDLLARALCAVAELPDDVGWLAICGSLPPGMAPEAVAELVHAGRARGLRVAVDTRGPALARALAADPELVRVNAEELEEVRPQGPHAGPPYPELGAPRFGVVSRGALPFDAWSADGACWRVVPAAVRALNPIGCGDAMLAGLLAELAGGAPFGRALRRATALACAEARSPLAGRPDLARARALEPQVGVERWRA